MGSFSGASASGYFALPITSAKRSPAAGDGVVQTAEKRAIRRKARLVFIHGVPRKRAPILLAPQRHYSTPKALSNRGPNASTVCKIYSIATIRPPGSAPVDPVAHDQISPGARVPAPVPRFPQP